MGFFFFLICSSTCGLVAQESVKGAGAAMSEHHADDPVVRWHQCQERNKHLNDRLAAALADITAKDNLVKQHAKVAEEAVTGEFQE